MSELEVLEVKVRDTFGKRRIRRLRADGFVPANLYGHKQETLSLQVDAAALFMLLRRGHQIIKLSGACTDEVLIKEVQWNVWGNEILHVDFTRINANEKLTVTVPVVLKGEAAGVHEGGVVEVLVHEVEVECSAVNVPDNVTVSVAKLGLGQQITVADVVLPEGITLNAAAETVLVQCAAKNEEVNMETGMAEGAEPEVIGRKKEAEEE
ncbi:MAG: 50S ribosomal protein L25 [Thermoguttaceae bacterium]|nr:50S ribosomal protein L25 [Thermoguttaceae bacterium]